MAKRLLSAGVRERKPKLVYSDDEDAPYLIRPHTPVLLAIDQSSSDKQDGSKLERIEAREDRSYRRRD